LESLKIQTDTTWPDPAHAFTSGDEFDMSNAQRTDPTAPLNAAAGTWQLNTEATTIELRTKAMWGLAKVNGTFAALHGGGTVGQNGEISGTLVIDAASVNTGQAKRDAHLRTVDFFDVANYPTLEYAVNSARISPDGKVTLAGAFTAHGQTHALEVRGQITGLGTDRLTITGEADIDRSEWGMGWTKMGSRLDNHITVTAVLTR
jgi:polyisoprenoid-binding protein YceI